MTDLVFIDGSEKHTLKLFRGISPIKEFPQTASNLLLGQGGGRFRRGDPTFSEFEQETWEGGAFNEFYYDDQTRFKESSGLQTRFPKSLFLQSLWKIATGLGRTREQYMPGSVKWISLTGDNRGIAVKPAGGATFDMNNFLIRRRGSPKQLTFEIRAESGGLPNGAAVTGKTVTKTISDVTDYLDEFLTFDWDTTQAFSNHWLVIYGHADDKPDSSHWEIGVDASTTGGYSISDPTLTTWQTATFKPYYLLSDADTDVKWHPMMIGTNMYVVSQPTTGNSVIKLWNETTKAFDSVSPTGDAMTGIATSVTIANNLGWIAKGSDSNIFQFDHNAGAPRMNLDAYWKADQVMGGMFPMAGAQLFLLRNNIATDTYCVKRFAVTDYNTDLAASAADTWSFEKGFNLLGMTTHDNKLWVRTQKDLYSIAYDANFANELITAENRGLNAVVENSTFMPMISTGTFLYYPFSYSTEYASGIVHKDIGKWRGMGMPDGMQGVDSAYCHGFGGIYTATDAGAGTSSVWFYSEPNGSWHESWRAWKPGNRIRNVWYQAQNGTTSPARLWINCGNDLIYVDQPDNGLIPYNDPDIRFCWGGHIVLSNHDFGAFQMPKFFEGIDLKSKNLDQDMNIEVDCQYGKDIGTTTWYPKATAFKSPISRIGLKVSDENELAVRLRFETGDNTITPILNAAVMVGVARSMTKRQWNFPIRIGHSEDVNPMYEYNWLRNASASGRTVIMYSKMLQMDNIEVIIKDVRLDPMNYNNSKDKLGAIVEVSVLEAVARENLQY